MRNHVSAAIVLAACFSAPAYAVEPSSIAGVTVKPAFFNPSAGQTETVSISVSRAGRLTAIVVDRDGYPVRTLAKSSSVGAGVLDLFWNGRDDAGRIVPDEAYSLKVDLTASGKTETFFPANGPSEMFELKADYYDRRTGILAYKLAKPARVHVQAGIAVLDPETHEAKGPVLKTIVNRAPRSGGSIVETWSGLDESGTVYVPDLANFVVGGMATALPESSILTVGNRGTDIVHWAAARRGRSLFSYKLSDHKHHAGLSTLEDVAPELRVRVADAKWLSGEKVWSVARSAKVSVSLSGAGASEFAKLPATAYVFVDGSQVAQKATGARATLELDVDGLPAGDHVLAVNWGTEFGPAAVNAMKVRVGGEQALAGVGR